MRKKIIEPGLYYSFGVKNINTTPEIFVITTHLLDDYVVYESKGKLFPTRKNNTKYCLLYKKIPTKRVKNNQRYNENLKIDDPFTVTYKRREVLKITDPKEIATITAALLKT